VLTLVDVEQIHSFDFKVLVQFEETFR
jgi:hypothetical protein